MSDIAHIILTYHSGFLSGLRVTLYLCAIIWGMGLSIGVFLGWWAYREPIVRQGVKASSFLLASIPVLIMLFWFHYPLQEWLGVVVNPFVTAAVTLSIINIVAIAQMVQDALDQFPNQYRIAGRVCGMDTRRIFFKIELPTLYRQLLSPLLSQQVAMLHMTLFASLISVEEIFRSAQRVNAVIYRPVEIYSALALFFIVVCLPLNLLAYWIKCRYTRSFSEK